MISRPSVPVIASATTTPGLASHEISTHGWFPSALIVAMQNDFRRAGRLLDKSGPAPRGLSNQEDIRGTGPNQLRLETCG
jgi:hypothetical protein